MKNNSVILIVTGILLSIVRLSIANFSDDLIMLIMSVINVIALDYVMLIIVNEIKNDIFIKLDKSRLSKEQIKKSKSKTSKLSALINIFFILFSILYTLVLRTSSLNDILSIIALISSILERDISKFVSTKVYKII